MKISLDLTWGRVFTLVAFGLLFWMTLQQQRQLIAFNQYLIHTQEVTERDFVTKEHLQAALQRQEMINLMLGELVKEMQEQKAEPKAAPKQHIIIPRRESPDERRNRYLREILEGRAIQQV